VPKGRKLSWEKALYGEKPGKGAFKRLLVNPIVANNMTPFIEDGEKLWLG